MKKARGFTLIELLMVIAIIGLLASVILASLGGARTKGVNARIQSDIHQYHTALELYYLKNGSYPTITGSLGSYPWACLGSYPGNTCWSNGSPDNEDTTPLTGFDSQLAKYIPALPAGQTVINTIGTIYVGYIYKCNANNTSTCDNSGYTLEWVLNGTGLTCSEQGTPIAGLGAGVTGCKLVVPSS